MYYININTTFLTFVINLLYKKAIAVIFLNIVRYRKISF